MRRLVEEVAGDELDHAGGAAPVATQVEDESIAAAEEVHRRDGHRSRLAESRLIEAAQIEVADVAGEALHALKSVIAASGLLGPGAPDLGLVGHGLSGVRRRDDEDADVLVVADRQQV